MRLFDEMECYTEDAPRKYKFNWLRSVNRRVIEVAITLGLVDEETHITREVCTCKYRPTGWGAGYHQDDCPVCRYYMYGGLRAEEVLRELIKDHI